MNEIRLTATWVAAAMDGSIVAGDGTRAFGGVSIDTRTLKAGDLFIAIRGERFDGADFADAAIEAGATGVVVPTDWHRRAPTLAKGFGGRGAVVIAVDDTTTALQSLASAVRHESGTKVVAITGSAGKTTTKDVTGEFLATRYRVVCNRGNLNNHIGLPLSLMALRQRPEIAVVELGMNHAGEISTLVRIAEPDVRVWTNVGEAHLGFFASIDAIADAKAEILERAAPETVLVANGDDDRIVERTARFAGRVTTFGIDRDADVRATAVEDLGVDGMRARLSTPRGAVDLVTPLVGRGNLANILAATAVALEFDIPPAAIIDTAAALRPSPRRGEVVRLSTGITIVDDSYNANPTAVKQALDVLARSRASRRIAVLGEMLELGDHADDLHADVGRAAATAGLAMLFTVGGKPAKRIAEGAIEAGMAAGVVHQFPASDEAASAVAGAVRRGDVVLVKGSRGVRTDRVVDRLKAGRG